MLHDSSAIQTKNLIKEFGSTQALNSIDLQIRKGEIYALIGPNGAGKTTLLKILVGLYKPTSGRASIVGYDVGDEHDLTEMKAHIGYVSDDPTAYEYLSGREFLALTGKMHRMSALTISQKVDMLSSVFPLKDIFDQPMGQYSRGNRQKLAFLAALLPDPKVLIIDEPIVGLDPSSIEIFGSSLRAFVKDNKTVLFATHILSFAHQYADRVGIMREGKLIKEADISKSTSLESLYESSQ